MLDSQILLLSIVMICVQLLFLLFSVSLEILVDMALNYELPMHYEYFEELEKCAQVLNRQSPTSFLPFASVAAAAASSVDCCAAT